MRVKRDMRVTLINCMLLSVWDACIYVFAAVVASLGLNQLKRKQQVRSSFVR